MAKHPARFTMPPYATTSLPHSLPTPTPHPKPHTPPPHHHPHPRRAETVRLQESLALERKRLGDAESRIQPLERELAQARAAAEARGAELLAAQEQAARWEKRTQQLLDKYKRVDVDEYNAVKQELQVGGVGVR